jgi:hypothetical protein
MTNKQFIALKRGQVIRYNAYNLLGMVVSSYVNRDVVHEVRVVWENGDLATYEAASSQLFSPIDPDSLEYP